MNLKMQWGSNGETRARPKGRGNNFFTVWSVGHMWTIFGCCVNRKDVVGSRGEAPGREIRGLRSLKLKHFYLLNVQWKPQIWLFLNISKCKKSQIYVSSCKNSV